MGLGDAVAEALELVGVTEGRVRRWLGGPCGGCRERRDKLNQLGAWARRVLSGKLVGAEKHLDGILAE